MDVYVKISLGGVEPAVEEGVCVDGGGDFLGGRG